MTWPFLILVAVFAILGATAWYGEKQRREELKAWCRRRGFGLKIARQSGLERDYPGLKLFSRGHGRFAQNTISGEWRGRRVKLMDYQYTTGSGKNRQTHKVGVVVIAADHPVIPLSIRRENPFDKVGEFLGADDIDFESAEFSRKFYVKSSDRKWAYDVIHQRTMDRLMRDDFQDLAFGFQELAVHRRGRFDPAGYEKALDLGCDVLDLVPDYVVRQMKGEDR